MIREEIEKLVQRWTEAIAAGRLDDFDSLLAPDVLDRSGAVPSQGVEQFKTRAASLRAAFSEVDLCIDDLIVEGDAIAWRWSLSGTHVGPFAGVEPTGRRVTLRGVNFQRLKSDRVVEDWTMVDVFGAVQALRS